MRIRVFRKDGQGTAYDHPDTGFGSINEITVDGVSVWKALKPKVRVHPEHPKTGDLFTERATFWKEVGEFDLYVHENGYVMRFPATYE